MAKKKVWRVKFIPSRDGKEVVIDVSAPSLGMMQRIPARAEMLEETFGDIVAVVRALQAAIVEASKRRQPKKRKAKK